MSEVKNISVKKRDGSSEPLDIEKINKVVSWAIKGLEGVSVSEIEMNARINFIDGISAEEIHESLVQAAVNLISLEKTNYQYVAARLLNYSLRKRVWGGKTPPRLWDHIKRGIEVGVYTKEFLKWYSKKEVDKINDFVEHDRDFKLTYAGIKQLCDKYSVQNRQTGEIFETPSFAYILISMVGFHAYKGKDRLKYVKNAYNAFSEAKINLPTPLMAAARTNSKSFSSCCLIDVDDTMDSIMASNSAVGHATSNKYGIGLNVGRIRPQNSPIRNGEVLHTGLIPFLKVFQATVKSCQQGGLRGGSATVNIPIWHYEIESILVLKNNAGTDDNRVRNLDYCVTYSKLFYERFLKNENITLFSPAETPGLYDAFGLPEFDESYIKYENDPSLKFKKTVTARALFGLMTKERRETGRIYGMNIDHANSHGPWLDKVDMTNLCVAPETLLLTREGNIVIGENEGKEVDVWNGKQWSKTKIVKTGENQKLIKVILKDGSFLDCTEYHKFYVDLNDWRYGSDEYKESTLKEIRAKDLKPGDKIRKCSMGATFSVLVEVEKIKDLGRHDDTYCVNETMEHKAVFNGILAGNCVEINHPLIPIQSLEDKNGEIGVCILSAINVLEIKDDKDLFSTCDIIVRLLDEIIDYQDYFAPAAENFATKRRSLGIGITNLAGYLAKNLYKYTDSTTPNFVDELMEKIQYALLKASMNLAKEKGPCSKFDRTKYSQGILPLDTYKKDLDKVVTRKPSMNWEELRKEIKEHGLRNSTLTAMMPCESSSVIQSSTNGIEPVRSLITYKKSKANTVPVIVPNVDVYASAYELAFDMPDNIGLINIIAAIQKWTDMAISANVYYNYSHYKDGLIPDSKLLKEFIYGYQMGVKTWYYLNSDDGDKEQSLDKDNGCQSGACAV